MEKSAFDKIKTGLKQVEAINKGDYRGALVHTFDENGKRTTLDGNKPEDQSKIRQALQKPN